ncbi:hypothetical protein GCM10022228_09600 [Halomonas cibimaris]|uniref:Integrase n=1 Tax=Halomonas cibimaris TaxID=657012 RepID=A0ABP7LFV2_9GAMM
MGNPQVKDHGAENNARKHRRSHPFERRDSAKNTGFAHIPAQGKRLDRRDRIDIRQRIEMHPLPAIARYLDAVMRR